jgi:hypothetical protein
MIKKTAGFAVAPIWHEFLQNAFTEFPERYPKEERFVAPEPITQQIKPALRGVWMSTSYYTIDTRTGQVANENTPDQYKEQRMIPNVSDGHDILHFVERGSVSGPQPTNPYQDEQYPRWEFSAKRWLQENGIPTQALLTVTNTTVSQTIAPKIEIIPKVVGENLIISSVKEKYVIETQVSSSKEIERVDFFLGGKFLGTVKKAPYDFAFIPEEHGFMTGTHTIRVVVVNTDGTTGESVMEQDFIE